MMKNKLLNVISLSALLLLQGCAGHFLSASDPKPLKLDATDSIAMQSLKQSMQYIPWEIRDTLVEKDDPLSNGSIVYNSAIISGVIMELSGSWMNLASFAPNPKKDYAYITAYVPADNIDISDKEAINAYINSNYIIPAIERFIENETDTDFPTTWVDRDKFIFSGNICRSRYIDNNDDLAEKNCIVRQKYIPIRYATLESGLPFNPEIKAERYIVATTALNGYFLPAMYVPNIDTNMISIYTPAKEDIGYSARYFRDSSSNIFLPVPAVRNLDNVHFFVKVKP